MSAYVVENETINKIVTYLAVSQSSNYERSKLKEMGFDLAIPAGCQKLHGTMLDMNNEAVNQRYNEKLKPPTYRYSANINFTDVSTLKSLSCFLYQCSEGDVPETWPLYKFLQETKLGIAMEIVSRTPEYRDAKWA